jgi:uncharacterized protein (TIGR02001 family)
LLVAAAFADEAFAQDATQPPQSAFQVTANAGIVSDYRYRGISLSDRDPAIQGGVDVTHSSGLFVGTWASRIANNAGSDVELDLYGGYSIKRAGVTYSVEVLGYVYPGGHDVDYFEISGTASKTIGPVTGQFQLSYAPSQGNVPAANLYAAARFDIALPSTPLTLRLRGGHESNTFVKKWDWETGLYYNHGPFTLSLSYVDSNYGGIDQAGRNGRAGVVAALTATF